jgi:hypothetical protein
LSDSVSQEKGIEKPVQGRHPEPAFTEEEKGGKRMKKVFISGSPATTSL